MRYAVSQFKNETDVLEIRLGTIADIVDRVIIGEASVDQRGRFKRLEFPEHVDRFAPWLDKIEYVPILDMPVGEGHEMDVARERHQRDALVRGLPNLQPDDLVYVSDLDEIPYPDALEYAFEHAPLRLPMDLFVYRLNWRWLDRGCRIGTLGGVVTGESILRQGVCGAILWDRDVRGHTDISGWHLTYQGTVEMLRAKVTGMMDKWEQLVPPDVQRRPGFHDEFLSDAWIRRSIETGVDIFGRSYRPTEWVGLDQLPPYVAANADRFSHMLIDRPANQDAIEREPRCTCGGAKYEGDVLWHFGYCAMAADPRTPTIPADHRDRPRSIDV